MTKHLLRDLDLVSDDLLRLTAATEDALAGALSSILSRDTSYAKRIIEGDAAIDQMEVRLEEECLKILALHSPVAKDLRFLIATIKINNDLERIADIASNIAKRTLDLCELQPLEPPADFEDMATQVRAMVRTAIHALVKRDSGAASRVRAMDDEVDDLNRVILKDLEDRAQAADSSAVPALMRWHGVVRSLERVADLAENIAEDVLYMNEGEIVRHD